MSTLQKIWDKALSTALVEYAQHLDDLAMKRKPILKEEFAEVLKIAKENVYGDIDRMSERLLKSKPALYQIMARSSGAVESDRIGMLMMISADAKLKADELLANGPS